MKVFQRQRRRKKTISGIAKEDLRLIHTTSKSRRFHIRLGHLVTTIFILFIQLANLMQERRVFVVV